MIQTTEQARILYAQNVGKDYAKLNPVLLHRLAAIVDERCRASNSFPMEGKSTYRAQREPKIKYNGAGYVTEAYITCSAFYFSKREAISFNRDGFIGFAGWSDSYNIKPILAAFQHWVEGAFHE